MSILFMLLVLLLSYLIGSIPFGWLIVKISTGKDIRRVESGRTGGTNAFRAAGWFAGVLTTILDGCKGLLAVLIAGWLTPGNVWIQSLAPFMAVIGHNYSIYMIERREDGKLHLRGGAGGSPCMGGTIGLWPASALWVLPGILIIYFGVGYASVTTLSIAVISTLVFIVRAVMGVGPWQHILYGVLSIAALAWALRPNLARILAGTERSVGLRAYLKKKKQS